MDKNTILSFERSIPFIFNFRILQNLFVFYDMNG